MCYECGCNDPNYKLTEKSITEKDFQDAADEAGITLIDAKLNTYTMLEKEIFPKGK